MIRGVFQFFRDILLDFVAAILGSRNPWERGRLTAAREQVGRFFAGLLDFVHDFGDRHHHLIGWTMAVVLLGGALSVSVVSIQKFSFGARETDRFPAINERFESFRPDNGLTLLQEISEALSRENHAGLAEKITELHTLRPHDARTYQLEGAWLTAQGDFTKARLAFQQSITLDPSEKIHRFNLAELEFMDAQYTVAEKLFLTARTMDPTNTKIALRLYLCALSLGDAQKAQTIIDNLPAMAQSPEWHCIMAAKAVSEGNVEQGRTFITAARVLYGVGELKDSEKTLQRTGYLPRP